VEELLTEAIDEGRLQLDASSWLAGRKVLYHGHCHQKAEVGTGATIALLSRIPGVEVVEVDAGCCGMAGSFGFESEHYDVSIEVGEDRLFPAVRAEPEDTVVAAKGCPAASRSSTAPSAGRCTRSSSSGAPCCEAAMIGLRGVVTFDLFSALIDSRSGGSAAFEALAQAHLWPVSWLQLYDAWDPRNKAAQRDCAGWEPWRGPAGRAGAAAYASLGLDGDPDEGVEALVRSMPEWPLWPDVPVGLPALREEWRIGLLSSVDDDLFASTAAALVDHDVALTSERLGVYKPHAAMYRRAVAELGPLVHVATSAATSAARSRPGYRPSGCSAPATSSTPTVHAPPTRSTRPSSSRPCWRRRWRESPGMREALGPRACSDQRRREVGVPLDDQLVGQPEGIGEPQGHVLTGDEDTGEAALHDDGVAVLDQVLDGVDTMPDDPMLTIEEEQVLPASELVVTRPSIDRLGSEQGHHLLRTPGVDRRVVVSDCGRVACVGRVPRRGWVPDDDVPFTQGRVTRDTGDRVGILGDAFLHLGPGPLEEDQSAVVGWQRAGQHDLALVCASAQIAQVGRPVKLPEL
jgi:2-haloacid dehalogenase